MVNKFDPPQMHVRTGRIKQVRNHDIKFLVFGTKNASTIKYGDIVEIKYAFHGLLI